MDIMDKGKLYIDLATKLGYCYVYGGEGIMEGVIESGSVDLAKDRTQKPIYHRNKQEQLKELVQFTIDWWTNGIEVIIEAPAIPFGSININSLRKQFSLYGVIMLEVGECREITPNEWFNWCINKYPHLKIWKETNTRKTIDRKKTSLAIASYALKKEIKDDNEADAINMMLYDNRKENK